jgi:hypothetical protein
MCLVTKNNYYTKPGHMIRRITSYYWKLIPSRGKDRTFFFCYHVQTSPGAHPTSCPVGTEGSYSVIKWLRQEADHSPASSAEIKNAWSYISLRTPWCRTLFEKLIVTQLAKIYPAFFMESEGSLPCSQKPTIGPYYEPAESSSSHRSLSP